jgi:2-oxoglutarate ferredoxin oxidoreductase subunit beta
MVMLALQMGATFVARAFSGDKEQLVPLIEAAVLHKGAAFIDVVSPCVAFNNHPGSTKSYDYVREHNEAVNFLDVMVPREPIAAEVPAGAVRDVVLHDGGIVRLRKVHPEFDPTNKIAAMNYLQERHAAGEIVTGLLYAHADSRDLHDAQETVEAPLNSLGGADLIPGSAALAAVNAGLR